MAIKVEHVDGAPERLVVTACLVNKAVLGRIAAKWTSTALPSRWANLIVGWAVEHYQEWKRAPGPDIAVKYDLWRANASDPATVELVGKFLETISDNYKKLREQIAPEFVLSLADGLMRRIQAVELRDRMSAFLEAGDVDRVFTEINTFRPLQLGAGAWIDVQAEEASMVAAFEHQSDVVVKYPGALGSFFGHALERDGFIAMLAPEKRGKSFWLLDMAWRALEQGRKVAHFEVGDMSRDQVLRRLGSRASSRPLKGDPHHAVHFPIGIEPPSAPVGVPKLETVAKRFPKDLTGEDAFQAIKKTTEAVGGGLYRLSVHPNSSISVTGIEAEIEAWRRDSWSPDIVVIDYADILAPIDKKADVRDQINQTWKALRGLSQKMNCLVVTATQSDAASYDSWVLGRKHFSEDKRKYAHVTGMFGLNQRKEEKDIGVYRLNWIVLRDLEFSENTCVYTAGHLAVGQPAMVSTF